MPNYTISSTITASARFVLAAGAKLILDVIEISAFFGIPDTLLSILVIMIGLLGGTIILAFVASAVKVPLVPSVIVLVGYVLVGSVNYLSPTINVSSPDAATYDAQAMSVAGNLGLLVPLGYEVPLHQGKEGFPVVLGIVYRLIGRAPVAGVVINAFLSGMTVIVILATSKLAFGVTAPRLTCALFMLSPTFVLYGSDLLREAFCWLGVALVVYLLATLATGKDRLYGFVWGLLGILLLLWMRTTLGLLTTLAMLVAVGIWILWQMLGRPAFFASLAAALAAVVLVGDRILLLIGFESAQIGIIRQANMDEAASGYSPLFGFLESFGVGGATLATLPNALLGPFPWELRPDPVWVFILMNSFFWWIALAAVFWRIWVAGFSPIVVVFLAFALILLIGMSVALTNYGLLIRVRAFPMIVMLVLMSEPLPSRQPAQSGRLNRPLLLTRS